MANQIRVTSMDSFEDQQGTLVLVNPDDTPRPVSHWSVPQWWKPSDRVIYAHCARVDNTATGETIYIASKTRFPRILIEESGGKYTFDSDFTREHVERIWITTDPNLRSGEDFVVSPRSIIVEAGGDTPDPLVVASKAEWVPGGVFETGQTVQVNTASYSGGTGSIIYRWRFQSRASAADDWMNTSWVNTTNEVKTIDLNITNLGQVRFQSQARETIDGSTSNVNSFASVKTISS